MFGGMSKPADPSVRKTLALPADLWRRIEDYQFQNRIKRDAVALRHLLELGLEAAKAEKPAPPPREPKA
jgi:hypothetical protein